MIKFLMNAIENFIEAKIEQHDAIKNNPSKIAEKRKQASVAKDQLLKELERMLK